MGQAVVTLDPALFIVFLRGQAQHFVHIAIAGHEHGMKQHGAAVSGGGVVGERGAAGAEASGKVIPVAAGHFFRGRQLSAAERAERRLGAVAI